MARKSDLLGFLDQRNLLAAVGGRRSNPITRDSGLVVAARMSFSNEELRDIGGDRELAPLFNRVMRNYGDTLVRRAQELVRKHDAIKTHLFISRWRAERLAGTQDHGGLKTRLALVNDAPYAGWVHPKGRKGRTIVAEMRGNSWLGARKRELVGDLERLKPRLAAALKNRALKEARKASRRGPDAAK